MCVRKRKRPAQFVCQRGTTTNKERKKESQPPPTTCWYVLASPVKQSVSPRFSAKARARIFSCEWRQAQALSNRDYNLVFRCVTLRCCVCKSARHRKQIRRKVKKLEGEKKKKKKRKIETKSNTEHHKRKRQMQP